MKAKVIFDEYNEFLGNIYSTIWLNNPNKLKHYSNFRSTLTNQNRMLTRIFARKKIRHRRLGQGLRANMTTKSQKHLANINRKNKYGRTLRKARHETINDEIKEIKYHQLPETQYFFFLTNRSL